ncbi:MarR family winged helix-turn-helix transcriptional regulator [Dasania marina]|uniref:MarR family winged helix-turn-helix transcriptional regulator n=1 Tax=Dasania marina TaxID=471499 RepID=UPI00036D5D8A|nr:MarR family transcriptional regulator [Dasania marina]
MASEAISQATLQAASRAKSVELVDPLENLLGYQLRRASILIMKDLHEALSSVELSPAEASVLLVIKANPKVKLIEVGRCLAIKRANMTPIVAQLEQRGLVERTVDGRAHALVLTPQGDKLALQVETVIAQHEQRCLGHLDKATQKQMQEILHTLRD